MGRALLDHYEDDSVAADATDIWTSPDVPNGQTWHLSKFGAAAVDKALVALQVRTSTGPNVWQTIRAVTAPGQHEFTVNRDYIGDGVIKFRLVRMEKSSGAQVILAWLEGYQVT